MSVYSYSQNSVIDVITFVKSEGGQNRAYLQAAPNVDPTTLHNITCKMAEQGWHATPFNLNGKPTLEILGFGKDKKLTSLLQTNGWVNGAAQVIAEEKDKLTFAEQVKKRSLAASGAFYLIGDSAFTTYGYKGADKLNMAAGLMYGAGTLSLLGFGRKDQSDLQVEDIALKLDSYLKEKGDNLPDSCTLESIAHDHQKGLIKKADDLFRRYPSEMMNIFFAAAGVLIAKYAYAHMHSEVLPKSINDVFKRKLAEGTKITESEVGKQMRKYHKLEGQLDIGLGVMTATSGLFAASIKEKAPDPDAPPKHGIDKAWEIIQNKPLAIAGAGYMVSTMCHAVSTGMAWKWSDAERRSSVGARAVFVGANIIAEILLAISSKGHGHGVKSDGSVDNTIISLAAEAIVKQPQETHETMIEHVANFLGRRDVLAAKNDLVRKQLYEQVEAMRKNPWAQALPTKSEQKDASHENWQARVTQPQTTGQQPQLS